jgi:hypothetical protein
MPELSEDYIEGYTKAKKEDDEELIKLRAKVMNLEKEYAILSQASQRDSNYIKENADYLELGKALKIILDYMKTIMEI